MSERSPGKVIWITGVSGVGKTTIGRELANICQKLGRNPIFLDGDEIRAALRPILNESKKLTPEGRLEIAKTYTNFCHLLSSQGFDVIIATISLFEEVQITNRAKLPNYFEVFIDATLNTIKGRDPKKIYQDHDAGKMRNVIGLDIAAFKPTNPEMHILNDDDANPSKIAEEIAIQALKT